MMAAAAVGVAAVAATLLPGPWALIAGLAAAGSVVSLWRRYVSCTTPGRVTRVVIEPGIGVRWARRGQFELQAVSWRREPYAVGPFVILPLRGCEPQSPDVLVARDSVSADAYRRLRTALTTGVLAPRSAPEPSARLPAEGSDSRD